MKNDYEVRGDTTAIIIESPKYGKHEALIDTEDLERVMEASAWALLKVKNRDRFYVKGRLSGRTILLHRHVLGVADQSVVDHVSRDTLDNRKSNLNKVTQVENNQNAKMRADNSSGYPGVYWHKQIGRWCARIQVEGIRHSLGTFIAREDAIRARRDAEKRHFSYREELRKRGEA